MGYTHNGFYFPSAHNLDEWKIEAAKYRAEEAKRREAIATYKQTHDVPQDEWQDANGQWWRAYVKATKDENGDFACKTIIERTEHVSLSDLIATGILQPVFDTSDLIFKNGRDTEPIVARHD